MTRARKILRPTRLLVLAILGGILLIQTGCGPSQGQRLVQEGASTEYGQGFDDGCSSGKKAAGDMFSQFHKNVRLYQQDTDYRQGWNDGHEECLNEWRSMERQQDLGIKQQRALNEQKWLEKKEEEDRARQALPKLNREQIDILNTLCH